MSVPVDVPENVPVETPGDSAPRRQRHARSNRTASPSYLTGSPLGWRFQWRIPKQYIASCQSDSNRLTIKRWLGPGPRRAAERIARNLTAMCQLILATVGLRVMSNASNADGAIDHPLLSQVVDSCHAAIDRAMTDPSSALSIASGLQSALSTLTLVATETARGSAGLPAVVGNADDLVAAAIESLIGRRLKGYEASAEGLTGYLMSTSAPGTVPPGEPQPPPAPASVAPARSSMPLFSTVARQYIEMREDADGENHPDIKYLNLRMKTFVELIGDKPVDTYTPKDLQDYVNIMQFWPANTTKRAQFDGLSTRQICEANRSLTELPLARKTMQEGYVANIRTMMRHSMTTYGYRDPFAGVKLRYPGTLRGAIKRETIDDGVLGRAFRAGIETGILEDAMLPLLAYLTGRRIGLLLYLQGTDIRRKGDIWIAQTNGIVKTKDGYRRVPSKTADSLRFFVLHDFLDDIGFVEWACQRDGFIFAAAHEHSDPARYVSKTLNRLLQRNGAAGRNIEVIHSLRHGKITALRDENIDAKLARQQVGHKVKRDQHDEYGIIIPSTDECLAVATSRLPKSIDWTMFKGLDFGALANGRHKRGAPIKRATPTERRPASAKKPKEG